MDKLKLIPKKIHQIWWQGEGQLPTKFKKWQLGWKKHHPTWEYHLWSEEKMLEFVEINEPDILPYYISWPLQASRADAFRYIVLKHLGGVYVDMDIECLRPIDVWTHDVSLLLSQTNTFNNAIFGGCSQHVFFEELTRNLKVSMGRSVAEFFEKSGPSYFSKTVLRLKIPQSEGCRIAPYWAFEPFTPYISDKGKLTVSSDTSRSYAIHHETLRWQSWNDRLLSLLSRNIAMPLIRFYINSFKKN